MDRLDREAKPEAREPSALFEGFLVKYVMVAILRHRPSVLEDRTTIVVLLDWHRVVILSYGSYIHGKGLA